MNVIPYLVQIGQFSRLQVFGDLLCDGLSDALYLLQRPLSMEYLDVLAQVFQCGSGRAVCPHLEYDLPPELEDVCYTVEHFRDLSVLHTYPYLDVRSID